MLIWGSAREPRMKRLPLAAVGLAWISPWLVGFILFLLIPAGMSLYYSFTDYPLLQSPLWSGLDNYEKLLSDGFFNKTLENTYIYAGAVVPLSIIISVVLAALLNTRGLRGARFFQGAIFLPTLVPLVASSMIFMWLFNGSHGLVNVLLRLVGITGPNWLLDRAWAMPALILIGLWSVGQAVVLCLAALQDVPESLYEAADIDGMGPARRFRHITVPMISPVILFNAITVLIGAFQVFVVPYVIFVRDKGGPGQNGYFYTSYLYDNAFVYGQMGYACAMAWVQMLIILALTGLMFLAGKRLVFYRAG
jgi:multiple sugar transport system permease protein